MSREGFRALARSVRPAAVVAVVAVVAVELLALAVFVRTSGLSVREPRYLLYPLVWVNAGLLAVAYTRPSERSRRVHLLAATVAAGYFLVLLVVDGSVAPAAEAAPLRVVALPPGWGPAVVGTVAGVRFGLFPFEVVGYAALAYLVYAVLLDAVSGVLGGVVGLFACVSCAAPGVAGLVAAVLGASAGAGAASVATSFAYDLSTIVFLAAVVVLTVRPFERVLVLPRPTDTRGAENGPE